jgi:flagellar motor switch protein FliN
MSEDKLDDIWGDALSQSESGAAADWDEALKESAAGGIEAARFQELGEGGIGRPLPTGDEIKMDVILDIPVTISMEIGRTQISIRNLLQLNQGSVVELDRFAGEPMDVLVNGTLIAHGEVVVVNEKFGIRLTDVISPSERVRKLS